MQPKAGTRPARAAAADTDAWTRIVCLPGPTSVDREPGPHDRTPAIAGTRPARDSRRELTVECFGDRVGDMRLYP